MREILHEIRSLDTSRRALRSFGLVVGAVFAILCAISVWRNGGFSVFGSVFVVLSALLVSFALVAPGLLRPVYSVWMGIAFVMGFIMTRVILSLVFFLLVLPTGLVMRLFGHDPLRRKRPAGGSYWIARTPVEDPVKAMRRSF